MHRQVRYASECRCVMPVELAPAQRPRGEQTDAHHRDNLCVARTADLRGEHRARPSSSGVTAASGSTITTVATSARCRFCRASEECACNACGSDACSRSSRRLPCVIALRCRSCAADASAMHVQIRSGADPPIPGCPHLAEQAAGKHWPGSHLHATITSSGPANGFSARCEGLAPNRRSIL